MKRWIVAGVVGIGTIFGSGCEKPALVPPKIDAATQTEIPKLIKKLESRKESGLALRLTIMKLGEAGPAAKSAVPALKAARKRANKEMQQLIDETIAKIEGGAPPAK